MSSTGQIVGGIVGAVVGFYVGGPAGALQGAALGAGLGGYLDPPKGPTVEGPRLTDQSVQTSTYGAFIPRVRGTVGLSGNLIWLENNKLKETVTKEESGGGKGGGGSSQTIRTYSYSATFAIGICEGPIAGVRRIWCGDKLLYNVGSTDPETIAASNANAKGWRLYLGTDDQLPNSRYEADVGVGNAPAFRGMSYIVFYDFELGDYGNTLQAAQFKFEVVTDQFTDGVHKILDEDLVHPSTVPGALPPSVMQPVGAQGQLVAFYPNWSNSYTTTGYFRVEILGDRAIRSFVQTNSNGAPLPGVAKEPVFLWSRRIFSATGIISSNDDFYSLEYNHPANQSDCVYAYTSDYLWSLRLSTGVVYRVPPFGSGVDLVQSAVISGAIAVDCNSSHVFVTTLSAIYRLDLDLNIIESKAITLPSDDAYIQADDSFIYHFHESLRIIDVHSLEVVDEIYVEGGNTRGLYCFGVSNGLLGKLGTIGADKGSLWQIHRGTPGLVPLSTIFVEECGRTGVLQPTDIDVSLLTDGVKGYRISGGTIRAALEPLQGAFPFDVIPSGYKVKAVPRGQESVRTIPMMDLVPQGDSSDSRLLPCSREMDSQLPFRVNIKYLDREREYAISEQYAERLNTNTINRIDRQLPLVMDADQAAGVCEVLLFLPWLEREEYAFQLPPTYRELEPADVVTIQGDGELYELRLTETDQAVSGVMACRAKPNRAALYSPAAQGGEAPGPDGTVAARGPSFFIPLDIPVVDEALQNLPGFIGAVAGNTESWPGALLVRSVDQGQTWANLQAFTGAATLGSCLSVLPANSSVMVDERSLRVVLGSGELFSISRDQMFAGKNYAAYGVNGRWEIIRFQNAELQADGGYLLSTFIRGDRGTEWATGLHQLGDYFVLLDDPDLAFMGAPVSLIGAEMKYRAVTAGAALDSASTVDFTYAGVNLECLSPVTALGTRDAAGNFTGSFTRRSRLGNNWWATGVPSPVGEVSESWEIDVMSGSTVKRTLTSSTAQFTYSAADQSTDFGGAQSAITFRIYQLSGTVGRGYPLEVTL